MTCLEILKKNVPWSLGFSRQRKKTKPACEGAWLKLTEETHRLKVSSRGAGRARVSDCDLSSSSTTAWSLRPRASKWLLKVVSIKASWLEPTEEADGVGGLERWGTGVCNLRYWNYAWASPLYSVAVVSGKVTSRPCVTYDFRSPTTLTPGTPTPPPSEQILRGFLPSSGMTRSVAFV